MKSKKSRQTGNISLKWLNTEQRDKLKLLAKRIPFCILGFGITSLGVQEQWRLTYIFAFTKLLFLFALLYSLYLIFPYRERINDLFNKTTDTYKKLTAEQKLYVNACLLTTSTIPFYLVGGKPFLGFYFSGLLLFYGYIALHDVLRWYKALSENILGKAIIGITFAAASNFAYSLAGQAVSQIVHVAPTNFVRTVLFIAILMIPILMIFAGGIVFASGIAMSSLVMFTTIVGNTVPNFTQWLFAGTIPESTIRFKSATRLFQFIFYSFLGFYIFTSGQKFSNWYESKISYLAPRLIYHFDMYEGRECKLDSQYKLSPLGDAKFLLAKISPSGDINFEPPVKCDDLPSH
ncbi:hypothetical protein [Vogesella oryzae]|uniref:hypothetical protein n=1 Tax=Vogesella oryzae TaxID=1735285 RepID=UPI001582C077|nr:hypothetical protein [Vogesella oryzae]